MALRNLVARMRTPAAAALRLPPPAPRVSPPRPRFYGSAQNNGKHSKGIDLESASIEEIRRQADLVGKEIDEALERTNLCREEVPVIWKDIWGTVRLWLVAGAGIELMLFADSCLRPRPEVEAEK
uniref:Uncharacterized protein n=1 Tax=Avena sativa TaxID=4498 RepID=A0ACD5TBH0_AVESA